MTRKKVRHNINNPADPDGLRKTLDHTRSLFRHRLPDVQRYAEKLLEVSIDAYDVRSTLSSVSFKITNADEINAYAKMDINTAKYTIEVTEKLLLDLWIEF